MNYISKNAKLGNNIKLGYFVVIEDNVEIDDNCIIGNNVVIHEGTKIKCNVRIDDNAVIGKKPMRSVNSIFKDEKNYEPCNIGEECIIGTNSVIYCGCVIGDKVLIADLASVRENVRIGAQTIIGRGAAVENFCDIGSNCKLETNVYLTAYSKVEDNVFIAPCVVTSNDNYASRSKERYKHFKGVTVKKGGRIGAGAVILPGKVIEEDGFAAAGSVVTKDISCRVIAAGNPAKKIKDVPDDQLLENQ